MPEPHRTAPPPLAALAAELSRARAELAASLPAAGRPAPLDGAGLELGRRNARLCDELLTRLYALAGAPLVAARPAAAVELAAVGSYGRGSVALKSDLDVRLLARDVLAASTVAEALFYPLWDMGVAIGHQVVTVDELCDSAATDLPAATSLLDWRHVAGDGALGEALRARAKAGLFAHSELPRFMARLADEVEQRHARFGASVYLLEPDVKNGAGGLRDLDVAFWAAKARFGVGGLEELLRIGAVAQREVNEIRAAREMLWRIRNLLHLHAGRRSDRLPFDEQEAIGALLGYGEGGEAVEHMMSDYYRNARTISRTLETMLARSTPHLGRRRPRDEDLGGGVHLFDGSATLADKEQLRIDPALALRLVHAAAVRGAPLLPYARDEVARAASDPSWCAELRASREAARLFVDLVAMCKETGFRSGSVVRELHDLGLLLAMIPEFSPLVGRVHHDVYHVYTVDVHSVAAVDRLKALARGELAGDYALASRLAAEAARPAMLYLATLLHDVGKAIGGSEHAQRGAAMARPILERLGFSAEDVDEACHLVRKHLVMYHVATRRDLDDPRTIGEFARDVHGREGLRDLYLLTVADLSTTSPTSMTSWKARMLDELYLGTDTLLAGAASAPGHEAPASGGDASVDARVARAVAEVERALGAMPAEDAAERARRAAFLAEYVASMPERYLLSNAPAAVAAHAEVARRHRGLGVSVELVPSRHPEAAEVCVVASDRPGLLAAIAAALSASRLEVHAAQIHSRALAAEHGAPPRVQAVDLFWVRDRGEGVEGVARALPKLVRDVNAVIAGALAPTELAKHRGAGAFAGRSTPKVPTRVAVDDRASSTHTVIEVTARDRPGLLYAIADALYRLGLSIAVAKINTEGTRVADVFYVCEADGSKVAPGRRTAEVESGLLAALERLEADARALP
jgi:[protein-PII] uridylyltransferase